MLGRTAILIVALAALCVLAPQAWPQGRGTIGLTTPGYMKPIGQTTATLNFVNYSYGLGGVGGRTAYGGGGDILRSAISTPLGGGAVGIARSPMMDNPLGAGSALSKMIASPISSDLMKTMTLTPDVPTKTPLTPGVLTDPEAMGGGFSAFYKNQGLDKAAVGYLKTIHEDFGDDLKKQEQAITSLVPAEPSTYKTFLERGEAAFKDGRFSDALGEFRLANDIGGRDWVSLLSISHAYFAMQSNHASAHYLREAIKYFPELPLLPLDPRGFYGNKTRYADNLLALEGIVKDEPANADAAMLLAYYRWFDKNPQAAQSALSAAMQAAADVPDKTVAEAIDSLWRGMVATGKVSGNLGPDTRPAATQPATSSAPAPK
ncbi:MAG: hypothetical protein ACE15C_11560 [Phycisphaerae bacterium]